MGDTITILLPHGEIDGTRTRLAPRLPSLEGKRVGFLDNELWRSMHIMCDEMAKVLTSEYGVVATETIFMNPLKGSLPKKYQEQLSALSQRVDVVVSGLGN
ncbi:MAG: hypothetical protein V3V35_05890 [Dehalococcoidia bacterium]